MYQIPPKSCDTIILFVLSLLVATIISIYTFDDLISTTYLFTNNTLNTYFSNRVVLAFVLFRFLIYLLIRSLSIP